MKASTPGRGAARRACMMLVLVSLCLLAAPPVRGVASAAAPAPAQPLADRAIVVILSGMTWQDLDLPQAADARKVFESGWVANLNCATLGDRRTVARALVSLGAGSRADAGPEARMALDSDERIENGSALEAYVRRTARLPGPAEVLHLGVAALDNLNAHTTYPVRPGLMGSVVGSLGRTTAALGNSDTSLVLTDGSMHREAVSVAMDEVGRVTYGYVGPGVLIPDPESAYGVRTNVALLLNRYKGLPPDVGLIVVDLGDTARAARFARSATPAAARFARARAMSRVSDFLERLWELAGEEAAIIIVSPVAEDGGEGPPALTPFSMLVPGARPGYATSGTTHRPGLVAGTDLVRTVRYVLTGADDAPPSMPGRAVMRAGGPRTPVLASLARASSRAVTVDRGKAGILWTWFFLELLGAAVALFLLVSRRADETASRLTEALLLWLVALPLGGLAVSWIWPFTMSVRTFWVFSVAPAVVLAAGLALTPLRPSRQVAFILSLTAAALLVDQLVGPAIGGPRLVMNTIFGYSPIDGARYYGIGNEGWSILFVAVALTLALWLDSDRAGWEARRWLVAAVLAAVAFVIGLPVLGANVGGFIAAIAGFATMWLGWDGRKPRPAWIAAVLAAILTGVGALVAFDAARAPQAATHFAGAAREVGTGGWAAAGAIAMRKLEMDLGVFATQPLSWLLVVVLAVLLVERRRPAGLAATLLAERPRFATALTGIFVGGVVGAATNDTGVAIAALMLALTLPVVLILMLAAQRWRRDALEL